MAKKTEAVPEPAVTIRMYCQGLGDCFLLTFPPKAPRKKPVRVLIDCGVLQRTPGEKDKLRQVAADIWKESGGKKAANNKVTPGEIDLLIVTHEHWDHVAGFSHARDIFQNINFGRVWLSWAENPADADMQTVKAEIGKKKKQLQAALAAAAPALATDGRANDEAAAIANLLDFFGPVQGEQGMDLGGTMDWLRAKVDPDGFCTPGQRRPVPGADGIIAYVLGPPRSVKAIRKMDPSKGQAYEHPRASLLGALERIAGVDDNGDGPFDKQYRLTPAQAAADPFFREYYGFPGDPLGDVGAAWRRIDHDWLGSAGRLALQLDTGVNNTSLALAFELPDGRTLIFPGDSQTGNWVSWEQVTFPATEPGGQPVKAPELLKRAVFYKVGHHASHNATLRPEPCGLEAMASGDLVAMIPVSTATAKKQRPPKTGWAMPFGPLHERLKELTGHRILRADEGEDDLDATAEDGKRASARLWNEFRPRVKFADEKLVKAEGEENDDQRLWVEYSISSRHEFGTSSKKRGPNNTGA